MIFERRAYTFRPGKIEVFLKAQDEWNTDDVYSVVLDHNLSYFTTIAGHMPESHRRHAEWTPARIAAWAGKTGPAAGWLVTEIMASRPHPEHGFRSCLGIMRLGKRYGDERLEAACARALAIRALSYRSVESILKAGLDALPLPGSEPVTTPIGDHANVRGPGYYA